MSEGFFMQSISEYKTVPGGGEVNETCSTCKWSCINNGDTECRCNSPSVEAGRNGVRLFPLVSGDDWCGDWEYKG
jgi:hypothetical protein